MNKDQFKGKAENLKGRGKDAAGSVSGNKETQAEGFADRAKGTIREKVGDVKENLSNKKRRDDTEESDDE